VQALNAIESKYFQDMIMSTNPDIKDKDILHRTAIQDRIFKRYKEDRLKLQEKLKVRGLI
jgi:superfamily I DNA and RNA helicase